MYSHGETKLYYRDMYPRACILLTDTHIYIYIHFHFLQDSCFFLVGFGRNLSLMEICLVFCCKGLNQMEVCIYIFVIQIYEYVYRNPYMYIYIYIKCI